MQRNSCSKYCVDVKFFLNFVVRGSQALSMSAQICPDKFGVFGVSSGLVRVCTAFATLRKLLTIVRCKSHISNEINFEIIIR